MGEEACVTSNVPVVMAEHARSTKNGLSLKMDFCPQKIDFCLVDELQLQCINVPSRMLIWVVPMPVSYGENEK